MKFAALGLALLVAPLVASVPAQAKLSAPEQRMVQAVEADRARSLALLEKLVNQNSGTLNLLGVATVGRMVRAELEPLGFKVRWLPMPETKRAGHIVATHPGPSTGSGAKGKSLLLIGHLDTVFERDSPFQKFTLKGEKATGPGVGDDKGGMVVMIAALRAMQAAGTLKDAAIEIVLTGDEERTGAPLSIGRRDLIAAGKRADAALDFEGLAQQDGRDMGSIARRSSTNWELSTTGKTGHSSGIFSEGAGNGAIYELARIIAAFRSELPEPNLTFNVGLIAGGATAETDADGIRASATGKTNIIPAVAIARGDMRTLSAEQLKRVQARMQAIVSRPLAGAGAKLIFSDTGYPAMPPTAGNRALLARLNVVNTDMGLVPMGELDPLRRGAGDIAFVAGDVAGLIGLGPASEGDHAPGETVDLPSMDRQAKRAAILMSRLAAEPR